MRSSVGPDPCDWCPYKKILGYKHAQGNEYRAERRQLSTSPGTPEATELGERPVTGPVLEPSEGAQPCSHLDILT